MVSSALTTRPERVLAWGMEWRRDLPWHATRDPWGILVCEVMAQQTTLARVAQRWGPFLARFPTPAAMAREPAAEVVRWWSGLGYNRRALHLHRAATVIFEDHGGVLPDDLEGLLALPGVGPYTARAVLAFAFEREVGIVDTNTARVLARWTGECLGPAAVQHAADEEVPAGQAWAWNQAMLDLGATVCRRRVPRCGECPVSEDCSWHSAGRPDPDPAEGTAGVSVGQSIFAGSDRQGRGALVAALRLGDVAQSEVAATMGWPEDPERARRVAGRLIDDGLVRRRGGGYALA